MKSEMGRMAFDRGSTKWDNLKGRGNKSGYGRDVEDWPSKQGMRRSYKQQLDYLQPVRRFLISSRNRQWNAVWSDVCAVNSNSSLPGFHLRQHVKQFVKGPWTPIDAWENRVLFRRYEFVVDDKGFLRWRPTRSGHPSCQA